MNLEFRRLSPPKAGSRRWNRIGVGIVLLTGLAVGAVLLLNQLATDRPNLYDPTRIALVEAQRNLSEAYGHVIQGRALFEQLRSAHRDLDEALTLLEKAKRLDPADRVAIDGLRGRLTELEDDQKMQQMNEADLRRNYQFLSEQIARLIERREQ